MKRGGQAWGLDVTVAAILFILGLIALYIYLINYKISEGNELKEIKYEATIVSDALLSEGEPTDWTIGNVNKIGIISKGKINDAKLEQFYSISNSNYNLSKKLLDTTNEYFINFSVQMYINGTAINGIGKIPGQNAEQVYKLSRFSSYQEKPVTINVISWKDE